MTVQARAHDLGGTVREVAAATSLARLKPRLAEFGITRLATITGLDTLGIPVITVVRPLGRSLSVSQGKGTTAELAAVSGIMESIETFHAEQRRPPAARRDLFECKRDGAFASPSGLTVRADAKLTEDRQVAWVEGEELFGGDRAFIPEELFDLDFSRRGPPPVFLSSSNGLASGNTRLEAIVHGLCEVIERDQISFWSVEEDFLQPKADRGVRLDTVTDPVCRGLIDQCRGAGLEVAVTYVTTNIDLPVFACTIADRHHATPYPQQATGHGAHPIAPIALARAITEAAQSRLTHIAGLREDLTWGRYRREFVCDAKTVRTTAPTTTPTTSTAVLARLAAEPTLDFGQIASYRSPEAHAPDMAALLRQVLAALERAGLERAIAVDLAVDAAFAVVFVCVPGLDYRSAKAPALYVPGRRMADFIKAHRRRAVQPVQALPQA